MKRIMIALAAVSLAFTVNAQQSGYSNYAGLTLGGGLNTMTFSPANGEQSLGLGFDAGLHYVHFFGEHIGLGLGVHYTYANAYAEYNINEVTPNLTHPANPGVTYDLHTSFNNWKERETVGVLGIPVQVFYRAFLSEKWTFIGGIGVQFDLPLHGSYAGVDGTYSTTGVFPALGGYPVSDVPEHGFSTYDDASDAKIDNLGLNVSAIIDLGVRLGLGNNWGLYFGLYGGYGINNMISDQKDVSMLVVDNTNTSNIAYNGTFASNEIDNLHMLRAGVKVGIDLGWDCRDREAERLAREKAIQDSIDAVRAAERIAAEKAAREAREKAEREAAAKKAAADRAAAEAAAAQATAERQAAEAAAAQAAADKAAAERAAAKAAAEREAAEKAAAERRAVAERTKAEAVKKIQAINATVYFETAGTKAKFDAQTDEAIHAICDALKADENLTVTVFGHTDNTGSHAVNMKYGQKRADALKEYMVSLGAPAKNIICVSKGPDDPIDTNETADGRAKNRRATVELK